MCQNKPYRWLQYNGKGAVYSVALDFARVPDGGDWGQGADFNWNIVLCVMHALKFSQKGHGEMWLLLGGNGKTTNFIHDFDLASCPIGWYLGAGVTL